MSNDLLKADIYKRLFENNLQNTQQCAIILNANSQTKAETQFHSCWLLSTRRQTKS